MIMKNENGNVMKEKKEKMEENVRKSPEFISEKYHPNQAVFQGRNKEENKVLAMVIVLGILLAIVLITFIVIFV